MPAIAGYCHFQLITDLRMTLSFSGLMVLDCRSWPGLLNCQSRPCVTYKSSEKFCVGVGHQLGPCLPSLVPVWTFKPLQPQQFLTVVSWWGSIIHQEMNDAAWRQWQRLEHSVPPNSDGPCTGTVQRWEIMLNLSLKHSGMCAHAGQHSACVSYIRPWSTTNHTACCICN